MWVGLVWLVVIGYTVIKILDHLHKRSRGYRNGKEGNNSN